MKKRVFFGSEFSGSATTGVADLEKIQAAGLTGPSNHRRFFSVPSRNNFNPS
jgi:hypothetical protein